MQLPVSTASAAVGGIWAWRQRLDDGRPLVLPQLDAFDWKDRPVLIVPDSDAWRETQKSHDVLSGLFALAKELEQRGASVQLVNSFSIDKGIVITCHRAF